MDKIYTNDVKALFEAILSLKNVDECYKFFEDALTEREIIDIAQRLKAAKMLSAGKSYLDVGLETGMSTATISRVSKALDKGPGGYSIVISRTGGYNK
jgi:TrpR-related protein YerC/YecD